jgi:hypothetical protein
MKVSGFRPGIARTIGRSVGLHSKQGKSVRLKHETIGAGRGPACGPTQIIETPRGSSRPSALRASRKDLAREVPLHIGEPVIASAVPVREPFMVEPEQMERTSCMGNKELRNHIHATQPEERSRGEKMSVVGVNFGETILRRSREVHRIGRSDRSGLSRRNTRQTRGEESLPSVGGSECHPWRSPSGTVRTRPSRLPEKRHLHAIYDAPQNKTPPRHRGRSPTHRQQRRRPSPQRLPLHASAVCKGRWNRSTKRSSLVTFLRNRRTRVRTASERARLQ